MKDPIETNCLILVWEKGAKLQRANQIPKSLIEAVNGCGEVIDVRVGRKVNGWIREQVGESSIMLDEASIRCWRRVLVKKLSGFQRYWQL